MSIKPTINKKLTLLKPPPLTPVLEAPLSDAYCLPALKSAVLWQCGFADLYRGRDKPSYTTPRNMTRPWIPLLVGTMH